nr:DUF1415 domain-containing protein [Bacteroidota bacterium]
MNPLTEETIISQTKAWITSVVIGCNFCPFAAKALQMKSIRYVVLQDATTESTLELLVNELQYLDAREEIETTLIILPNQFNNFEKYLDLAGFAEALNSQKGYDGIYQIASFHPEYLFAGSNEEDPANYTNRSAYPMLHILREESVTRAVENY